MNVLKDRSHFWVQRCLKGNSVRFRDDPVTVYPVEALDWPLDNREGESGGEVRRPAQNDSMTRSTFEERTER